MTVTSMAVSETKVAVEGMEVRRVNVKVGASFTGVVRTESDGVSAIFVAKGAPARAPRVAYLTKRVGGGAMSGVWEGNLDIPASESGTLQLAEVVSTAVHGGFLGKTTSALVDGPTIDVTGQRAPRIVLNPPTEELPLGGKNYAVAGRLVDVNGQPFGAVQNLHLQVNDRVVALANTDDQGNFRFLVHDSESVPENGGWLRLQPQRVVAYARNVPSEGTSAPVVEAHTNLKVAVPVSLKPALNHVKGPRKVLLMGKAIGSGGCQAMVERRSNEQWHAVGAPAPVSGNGTFTVVVNPVLGKNNQYRAALTGCDGVRVGTSAVTAIHAAR